MSTHVLISTESETKLTALRKRLKNARPVDSLLDVRQFLDEQDDKSIRRVDLIAHGTAGRMKIGDHDILELQHTRYSRLEPTARKFAPGGRLRLLGCIVGRRGTAERWHDGLALAYALSAMLDVRVEVTMDPLIADDWNEEGEFDDRGRLEAIDATLGVIPRARAIDGRIVRSINQAGQETFESVIDRSKPITGVNRMEPNSAQTRELLRLFDTQNAHPAGNLLVMNEVVYEMRQGEVSHAALVLGGAALLVDDGTERYLFPRRPSFDDAELKAFLGKKTKPED